MKILSLSLVMLNLFCETWKYICSVKIRKNFYKSRVQFKLLWSSMVILDVYRSFVPNKPTFTKYCLTQWISKVPGSYEIHWVRQYLVNFTGLVGIVNTTVYKTKPIFIGLGHGKLFWFVTLYSILYQFSTLKRHMKTFPMKNKDTFILQPIPWLLQWSATQGARESAAIELTLLS